MQSVACLITQCSICMEQILFLWHFLMYRVWNRHGHLLLRDEYDNQVSSLPGDAQSCLISCQSILPILSVSFFIIFICFESDLVYAGIHSHKMQNRKWSQNYFRIQRNSRSKWNQRDRGKAWHLSEGPDLWYLVHRWPHQEAAEPSGCHWHVYHARIVWTRWNHRRKKECLAMH